MKPISGTIVVRRRARPGKEGKVCHGKLMMFAISIWKYYVFFPRGSWPLCLHDPDLLFISYLACTCFLESCNFQFIWVSLLINTNGGHVRKTLAVHF
jgi:hypothetical protein